MPVKMLLVLKVVSPWPTIIKYKTYLQLNFISNYVIQYNMICTDSHVFANKCTSISSDMHRSASQM